MSRCTLWKCPRCQFSSVVSFGTDGRGNLTESRSPCLCEQGLWPPPRPETEEERHSRRRLAGVCRDCDEPVEGTVGKAVRCAVHKRTARLAQCAASKRRHRKKVRRWQRKHRRRPEVREHRCARRRELHAQRMQTDPEYATEYRRRRQRETLFSNPNRDKYLATQRRHNADPERQERKRAMARARYYELHQERPSPVCTTCGKPIEWTPPGRPPKYHQAPGCNPHWASRRQARERGAYRSTPGATMPHTEVC